MTYITKVEGPRFITNLKSISSHDISQICIMLGEAFNKTFESKEYEFIPDGRTGSIQVRFPGYKEGMCKAISFDLERKWPSANEDNVVSEWLNKESVILFPRSENPVNSLLIAESGAPIWTLRELLIVSKVFGHYNFPALRSGFPHPSSLMKKCDLGRQL